MEATIYYLNWDLEQGQGPASELFHKTTIEDVLEDDQKPGTEFTEDEFDELYREITTAPVDVDKHGTRPGLEKLWQQWNRGSGVESREFLEQRYCNRCDSYIEGQEEAASHAAEQHSYDTMTVQSGEPDYIRGVRSMSVGDVVELDTEMYQARAIGWSRITVGEG